MQESNNFQLLQLLHKKCSENNLIDLNFEMFLQNCINENLIDKKTLSYLNKSNIKSQNKENTKQTTYKKTYQTNWLNHVRKVSIEKNISWKDALVVAKDTYIK